MLEDAGYEVIGEAPDGGSGIAAARELRPSLVLLDVQLPDCDGFEVARRLTNDPVVALRVVLTSSRDASDFRRTGLLFRRAWVCRQTRALGSGSGAALAQFLRVIRRP